ncbi:MAG: benzoyl-CoA 2,3-epoxidase subunit BoxB, partial [Rhodospirillales bacterium]|nr:benzoyl-CoA 2,3-epoxidase subunit BoxB [Rhodospirillales bacterium]
GTVLGAAEWAARRDEFLPSSGDAAYVASLMRGVTGIGAYAGWIAPPRVGIDGKPGDFEYVRIEDS